MERKPLDLPKPQDAIVISCAAREFFEKPRSNEESRVAITFFCNATLKIAASFDYHVNELIENVIELRRSLIAPLDV